MSDVLHLNWPIRLPLCHHALSSIRLAWYIIGNPDNIILLRLFITHRHVAKKNNVGLTDGAYRTGRSGDTLDLNSCRHKTLGKRMMKFIHHNGSTSTRMQYKLTEHTVYNRK